MEKLISKSYFETVATNWDNMGNSFFGDAPRDAIYQQLNLQKGMTIADIGSGSGYLLEGLAKRQLNLIAIDQSPQMIERVIEKLSDPSLRTLVGTSENLPVPDNSVDFVIANMYLHHVERPYEAIVEMVRILKPGGQLIFTDLDKHNYEQLLKEQFDRWMGFERRDIQKWMEDAGLGEVHVDCVGSDCCTSTCSDGNISINIFIAKGIKK